MKNNKSSIVVCTWYDTITPESAEHGDCESTGNDERSFRFSSDEIDDAVAQFVYEFEQNCWDESNDYRVGDVLYAADNEVDYHTGAEDSHRLTISVVNDSTFGDPKLRTKLQAALDKTLEGK